MRLALVLLLLLSSAAWADDIYVIVVKKQEEKKRQRWTLEDWLRTKARMRMMDAWLAMNSSDTWFEGYLGGGATTFQRLTTASNVTAEQDFKLQTGNAGLFVSILGVQGEYHDSDEPSDGWNASASLRLLGTGIQNSHWTVGYGLRHQDELFSAVAEEFENPYWESAVTIYLFRTLGVRGLYRGYQNEASSGAVDLSGYRWEGSIFLELSFLRLSATWFGEPLRYTKNGTETEIERSGVLGGLQLFF